MLRKFRENGLGVNGDGPVKFLMKQRWGRRGRKFVQTQVQNNIGRGLTLVTQECERRN